MANIISASRRTDIPRFFGAWFAERRRQGHAQFRNAFGGKGKVSLRDQNVLGYLFWTRLAAPFADQLATLRRDGIPYAVQYTITGYGRDVEPHIPRTSRAIEDFRNVSRVMPSPSCIEWRYDPILLSECHPAVFHRQNFRRIARALRGYTRVANTSVVEPYVRTVRRLDDSNVRYRKVDPKRHKAVARRWPALREAGDDLGELMAELEAIAAENGMQLRSCSNPEWALSASQCCAAALFEPYGDDISARIAEIQPGPSRDACRCLKSVDIGMDNTCLGGCKYCYAVTSHAVSVKNHTAHDAGDSMLR